MICFLYTINIKWNKHDIIVGHVAMYVIYFWKISISFFPLIWFGRRGSQQIRSSLLSLYNPPSLILNTTTISNYSHQSQKLVWRKALLWNQEDQTNKQNKTNKNDSCRAICENSWIDQKRYGALKTITILCIFYLK